VAIVRRFVSGLAAILLALGLFGYLADSARAVSGYDSAYFGESAFLSLNPGQSGQFVVGFNNTGSTGWLRGSASQVDLQVCGPDKVTCGIPSANAAWASNWLSSTAYATTSTAYVGPGQTGFFVYNIVASGTAGQTARFNGDLALHASGQQVHPQGYYQDATVNAGALTIAPPSSSPVVGSTVQFSVSGAAAGSTLTYTVTGGCGTITASGLFTATAVISPCSVVATTSAGQSASATVNVISAGGGGGGGGPVATRVNCGAWETNPISTDLGSTSTTVSILDQNGSLFTSGSFSVSFTSTAGTSTFLVTTTPQSTSGGTATFTVQATGRAGTDTYQASSSGLTTGICPPITAR
jgi:hypothetical protein